MSCQLSLLLTPNNEQTLETGQQVILSDSAPLSLNKDDFTSIDSSISDNEEKIKGIKITNFTGKNTFMYLNKDKDISNYGGYIQMQIYNPNNFDINVFIGRKEDNSVQYIIKTEEIKQLLIPINSIIGTTDNESKKIENLKNIKGLLFSVSKAEDSAALSRDGSLIISTPIYIRGISITDSTLQANSTIIYNGGQPLELTKSESNSLRLMSYTDTVNRGEGAWASSGITALPTVDGNSIKAFLLAYFDGGVNIGYVVAAPGTSIATIRDKIKEETTLDASNFSTKLLGILNNSKYYNNGWNPIEELLPVSSTYANFTSLETAEETFTVYNGNKWDIDDLKYTSTSEGTSTISTINTFDITVPVVVSFSFYANDAPFDIYFTPDISNNQDNSGLGIHVLSNGDRLSIDTKIEPATTEESIIGTIAGKYYGDNQQHNITIRFENNNFSILIDNEPKVIDTNDNNLKYEGIDSIGASEKNKETKIYFRANGNKNYISSFNITAAPVVLTIEGGLYYSGYSPIYTQADNVIIDPQNAQSYFLSNHPCNKYVLPRLIGTDTDGEKIQPLQKLEISRLSIRS